MSKKKYIDADAFIAEKRALYCEDCNKRKNIKGQFCYEIGDAPCRACEIDDILDAVEDYPAADVEEVRHGYWKICNYPSDEHVECSECHAQYYENDLYLGGNEFPKRCPECGAHMDAKEEEE